jgi:hypothetical protein
VKLKDLPSLWETEEKVGVIRFLGTRRHRTVARARDGVIFPKDEKNETTKREARRQRLNPCDISGFLIPRIADYYNEAENSFINGCFRSCIICSAITVELTLKHALIFRSEYWEETYWEIEVKKLGFRDIIRRLAKTGGLGQTINHAHWLRKARNEITAHPSYVEIPFNVKAGALENRDLDQYIWASKTMLRDIRKARARFRYWVGTHEWHKTKDLLHVQAILGHKNIEMTRKYVKMSEAIYSTNADDDFHTRVATTQAEIVELLNSGFDYVMQKDGLAYFRKRD